MNELEAVLRQMILPERELEQLGETFGHERLQRGTKAFLLRLAAAIARNLHSPCVIESVRWYRPKSPMPRFEVFLEFEHFGGTATLCLEPGFVSRCSQSVINDAESLVPDAEDIGFASAAAFCLSLLSDETLFQNEALSLVVKRPAMSQQQRLVFSAALWVQLAFGEEAYCFVLYCDETVFLRLQKRAEALLPLPENVQLLKSLECPVLAALRIPVDERFNLLGMSESANRLAVDVKGSPMELLLRSAADAKPVRARVIAAPPSTGAKNEFFLEVL